MVTQVPSPKGAQPPPIFGPCLLWSNGWTDQEFFQFSKIQDATWYEGKPQPGPQCVTWGPSSPLPKGAQWQHPIFRLISIVGKWLPISATAEHLYYMAYRAIFAVISCILSKWLNLLLGNECLMAVYRIFCFLLPRSLVTKPWGYAI